MYKKSSASEIGKSKRIASNTLMLFVRMLVIMAVNLYTVRWVLRGLGVEDYGVYNAIGGVVTTSTCLTSVLALATQRFYSYAIGQGETDKLKQIFSISTNLVMGLSLLILLVFETVGLWFVNTQMTIPTDRMVAANWIYQLGIFSFIFSVVQIPFMGTVFAREQMGTYAVISTFDCFAKFLVAYYISQTSADRLVFYGWGMMLVALCVMLSYMIIARRRYEECRYINVKDTSLYYSLLSFAGWTFYGTLANVGMIQGSIILLNVFFSPVTNAAFAIANQIYNALNTLCNSVVLAFRPAMIKAYSGDESLYLDRLFYASNKVLAYLLIAVAIPFIYEIPNILNVWLGEARVTGDMMIFSRLFIIYTVLMAMHNPITIIVQATGRIKMYSICVETLTIASLPISWLLFQMGMHSSWIFASLIGTCVLAHAVRVIILRELYPAFSVVRYVGTVIVPACLMACVNTLALYGLYTQTHNLWLQFFCLFIASFVLTVLIGLAIGANKVEKRQIMGWVKQILNR